MKDYFTFFILIYLAISQATAAVVVGGTRFIYPQDKKMIVVPVDNTDKKTAYLIQGWIEKADGITKSKDFILTPVLFQLDAGKKGILRVMLKQAAFPEDRETLLWLNIRGSRKHKNTEKTNFRLLSIQNLNSFIVRRD